MSITKWKREWSREPWHSGCVFLHILDREPQSLQMPDKGYTSSQFRMIEEQAYKLNESINELMQTEKTYIGRLHTILDVFQVTTKAYINDDTDTLIFGSVGALIKCNEAFFKGLDEDYVKSLLNHVHPL